MLVSDFLSQVGSDDDAPVPYTASLSRLLWSDVLLCFRSFWAIPQIFLPLTPWRSGELDELYPSLENLVNVAVHFFLVVFQFVFLLSLPLFVVWMLPTIWIMAYVAFVLLVNYIICRFALNGSQAFLVSKVPVPGQEHQREHWIYINGISIGHHWLQKELDRLAYTFGRKITGIHNTTHGIIFDIIECIMQRCFNYATRDIREAYPVLKNALLSDEYDKVVLILHSQGGIEGGLSIDWMLANMPQEALRRLEVYTFGNAANHFNNPHRSVSQRRQADARCIPYIEHYANSEDAVALMGVLNFAGAPNRYLGRLFVRPGSGHLLNQHYLDTMFTLGPDWRVLDDNPFMDMVVGNPGSMLQRDRDLPSPFLKPDSSSPNGVGRCLNTGPGEKRELVQVKDLSRLWRYRNGGSPRELRQSCGQDCSR